MKSYTERAPLVARTVQTFRDPYQLERALGVVLWIAFFVVLFSLGD